MYSAIISLLAGSGVWCALYFTRTAGAGWSSAAGAGALLLSFMLIQRAAGRKMRLMQDMLKNWMTDGQARLQSKIQRMQMRINSVSAMKQAQAEIEGEQRKLVQGALEMTKPMESLIGWVPLMKRQLATMRLQFYWTLKDYKTVDALIPSAILMDPMLRAIVIARMYMRNDPTGKIAEVYKAGIRRPRYNACTPLHAVFSWIQVKRGDIDGAFKTLTAALENTDNPIIKANHAALQNNRVSNFSNQPFGDLWFMLALEEPKIKMQRQHGFPRGR